MNAETESPETPETEAAAEENPRLQLGVKVDNRSACERHVTVTVAREDIDRYLKKAFDDIKGKAEVPGFRPGRAPRKLVESRFRDHVRDQVKGSLLMDSMAQLSEDQVFTAIGEPDFDVNAISLPDDGPLTFEFNIEVRPEFDLPEWRGLKLDRLTHKYTDDEVSRQLARLLAKFSHKEPVAGPAQADDFLTVNITVTHNGQTVQQANEIEVAVVPQLSFSDAVIEGFADLATGAQPGQTFQATTKVSEQSESEAVRGQEVVVVFEVLDVKRTIQPELTAAFLQEIGGFADEAELREMVRAEMERQFRFHQQRNIRQQITDQLTRGANWALPPSLLRRQMRRELDRLVMELQSSGFSNEDIRVHANQLTQNSLANTERALKEHFILERIAEEHKIEALPDDYDAEIELIADQSNEPPRRVRARMEKRGLMDTLRNQIIERKAIELITDAAEFAEKQFQPPRQTTFAVNVALSGDVGGEAIPEAKHGGEAGPIPNSADIRK
ncbi:MAG: trigger factor [Pirellulales bacterium]